MKKNNARKITFLGLMFSLGIVLSYLESMLPALPGLPPGMKLGLSNIVTIFCLVCYGPVPALILAVLKSLLALITRGMTASLLSLAGGVLSVAAMTAILIISRKKASVVFTSIFGAVFHNVGQILMACLLLNTTYVIYYVPVLVISGVIVGILTGIASKMAIRAIPDRYK